MNANIEFDEAGRYMPWPKEVRFLRRNLPWIVGCAAMAAGALTAMFGNVASSASAPGAAHWPVPLGIVLATMGALLLVTYVVGSTPRRTTHGPAGAGGSEAGQPLHGHGTEPKERSMARELQILAALHAAGVLSPAEFKRAKRRVLRR